jgi:hypothetical protein
MKSAGAIALLSHFIRFHGLPMFACRLSNSDASFNTLVITYEISNIE